MILEAFRSGLTVLDEWGPNSEELAVQLYTVLYGTVQYNAVQYCIVLYLCLLCCTVQLCALHSGCCVPNPGRYTVIVAPLERCTVLLYTAYCAVPYSTGLYCTLSPYHPSPPSQSSVLCYTNYDYDFGASDCCGQGGMNVKPFAVWYCTVVVRQTPSLLFQEPGDIDMPVRAAGKEAGDCLVPPWR